MSRKDYKRNNMIKARLMLEEFERLKKEERGVKMVVMTDDLKLRKKLGKALKQNGGYCPCMVEHIPDNACKCKEFRDMVDSGKYGECRCGLWINKEI